MDLVIRNGTIYDGTGGAPCTGDIGIEGDTIAEVGRVAARGKREIDADGAIVTPGFIDLHTHFDGQATWDSYLAPSSHHGVTSLVMGNCGVGFAPARPGEAEHQWLIGLLEGVEDIPGTALAEGLPWDWESFPDYLDALARRRYAVDLGAQVPHAALRTYVMGRRGADAEAQASGEDIAAMRRLAREALEAGALGFTTSRTFVHRTRDGENIGTYRAPAEELLGVAGALADAGRGVMQLITDAYVTEDLAFRDAEIALVEAVARTIRRPLSFTVQQPDLAAGRWRELFDFVGRANAAGLDIKAQVAPRPIGVLLTHQGSLTPFIFCRAFQRTMRLPLAERVAALRDPALRATILAELRASREFLVGLDRWPWERMFPLSDPPDYEPSAADSVAALAAAQGVPADEYAYDYLLGDDGRAMLYCPLHNYVDGSLDVVREMLTFPHSLLALSDAGAHCGVICDASFPTTTLALWGRDRSRGEGLPLEFLVQRLTRRNAEQVGWLDRGLLRPGLLADVNVIDFDKLRCRAPHIVHDLPAGGRRLVQEADGYRCTVKRGTVTFENGKPTGELPGSLVRGTA
ncbi:MAG: amidohydrolase family protein [Gammaproteobacteria bacterium]|nr:amidohydrolase family protein [Gammaproteobacteria bacterium]MCP5200380.1 amidohydrolase family protein [Gammaproteobacteria bacterium]